MSTVNGTTEEAGRSKRASAVGPTPKAAAQTGPDGNTSGEPGEEGLAARAASARRLVTAPRNRRRPALLGLGAAIIAVAALGVYLLVANLGDTTRVVVVTSTVAAGDAIQADQVSTADVQVSATIQTVPGEQLQTVVGQRAVVPLLPGQLLNPDTITTQPIAPSEDAALVGLPLTTAQLPSVPIQAGDEVLVVDTPPAQGDPPVDAPDAITATVASSDTTEDGLTILNVYAPPEDARALAARAATGRIQIVLTRSVAPAEVG